jgi:hypothetical protein
MAKTIGQLTQATTLASGDEFIIEQSGLTKRVAASVVRGGLIDADIDAAADIAGSKLADDAITTAKIDDDAVTTAKIDDDAVTTAKIDDDAVTTAKIDDDAVTTAKILDANVTPAKLSQPLTLETAKATTSGTEIDFTSIPSWVKRITVMLDGVSTNGSSVVIVQLGDSGGIENTGYASSAGAIQAGAANCAEYTSGFGIVHDQLSSSVYSGLFHIATLGANAWAFSGSAKQNNRLAMAAGTKTLSDTLTQVRLTTVNGTDTFDAGEVNIMYEG